MFLKQPISIFAIIMAVGLAPAPGFAQEGDKVIATVGGQNITVSDLEGASRDIGSQFASIPEPGRQAAILDALIDIVAISQRADAEGLGDDAAFKARMALLRKRALHNIYITNTVSAKIKDEEVKARYEAETSKIEEIKARHILVKTEKEALEIIKMLDEGADFIELAKTKSTGPSGSRGGDLGYFGKGQMVPEFEKAAFALEVGKYSAKPAKTQFGYHVIKLDERRKATPPPYEKAKAKYRQMILRERYADLIKDTRGKYKVEILDESLRLPGRDN